MVSCVRMCFLFSAGRKEFLIMMLCRRRRLVRLVAELVFRIHSEEHVALATADAKQIAASVARPLRPSVFLGGAAAVRPRSSVAGMVE
jgi:hypothetical protein